MTTDTLQFKNNVGEIYNAPIIAGDVDLTNKTYDVAKRLFSEKTKTDKKKVELLKTINKMTDKQKQRYIKGE